MCWTIDKNEFVKFPKSYHKIADKDIEVYKLGNISEDDNCFHSYFKKCFSYKPNVLNEEIKLNLEEDEDEDEDLHLQYFYYNINEGYHSYSGECKYFYEIWPRGKVFCVETINKEKPASFIGDYIDKINIIGEFIIPKGTEYYENEYGDIVSTQLVWTGKFKHLIDIKLKEYAKVKFKDIDYVLGNK